MNHVPEDMPPHRVWGSESTLDADAATGAPAAPPGDEARRSGSARRARAPSVPWFAEPVDEEERFAVTGWAIGADEEFDEPDVYPRADLVAWGFAEPDTPTVGPAGPAVTALVAGAVGPLVASHRRRNRWTQRSWGRRFGLDQPRVSRHEHGRVASMTVAQLAALALETESVVVLEIAPGTVADLTSDERVAGGTSTMADLPAGGKVRVLTSSCPAPPAGAARPVAWAIP
jgi:hypothetical protein